MTNPNQQIFDDQVRRRIYLDAFSDREVQKVQRFLREVRSDLRGEIARLREAFDGTRRQALRIASQEQLLASMARLHGDIYQRLEDEIDKGFQLLATAQAGFEAGTLSAAASASVSELTTFQAIGAVRAKPMNGKLLSTWMEALEPDHIERINQAMRISFTEGESMTRAIDRLQQVVGVNYRGAEAMVRTSHTHIAAAVQEATYAANDDLVGRYEWRSVLDSRTSPICRARDGKMWPVGRGPMPPAHIRCRSTTTAVLDGFDPPERETYGEWLKRQPPQVQDSILGPTKANAFRSGKLSIGDFVKPTGKPLTLGELKLSEANITKQSLDVEMRDFVLKEGRARNIEYLGAYDDTTLIKLSSSSGTVSSVMFPADVMKAIMDKNRSITLHHNHPSSSSFSEADLSAANTPGVSGIWAHGHNGSSYFAAKSKGLYTKSRYKYAESRVRKELQASVNAFDVTPKDANALYGHIIMLVMKKKGYMRYEYTLKDFSKTAADNNAELIERILKKFK